MPNRLQHATSPYLQQHAHNPVDWFPWGEEALLKAKREEKPIFLSIGYSACHWCHVMERESFENIDTAALLNRHFVSIKVDREERPDLDDLYMDAVQMLTGRGGWPMSVFLTPDLKPFFGGTYFPPGPRYGMPGFPQVLDRIADLWREQRLDLVRNAGELVETLSRQAHVHAGTRLPEAEVFESTLRQLRSSFDGRWGGFGPAPKFPAHMAVELLLRRGNSEDHALVWGTLDAMWEGGMYDHLGGGFARYSVDEKWLVPHFEKMLYDNAQLTCVYLSGFQVSQNPRYAEVARETLDYLLRDLRDEAGGFYSAEDADSEGVEGKFYVYRPDQVIAALGEEDGRLFCQAYGISEAGNFEHGTSVLHRYTAPKDLASRHGRSPDSLESHLRALRQRLLKHREHRVRPFRDDKVLTAWNGLALSAFSRGHQVLGDPRYLEAATACAGFLKTQLFRDGVLLRTWREGHAHTEAFLEDYAAVVRGLVDLYEAGFDAQWLRWAETLADAMQVRFEDQAEGGFFSTEADRNDLLFRQKPGWDNAIPSGNSLAIQALLRLHRHLNKDAYRDSAQRALICFAPMLTRASRAFLAMLVGLDELLRRPLDLVVAGDPKEPMTQALLGEVRKPYLPGVAISMVASDPTLPLHEGRSSQREPAVFLCQGMQCEAPLTSKVSLSLRLSECANP